MNRIIPDIDKKNFILLRGKKKLNNILINIKKKTPYKKSKFFTEEFSTPKKIILKKYEYPNIIKDIKKLATRDINIIYFILVIVLLKSLFLFQCSHQPST